MRAVLTTLLILFGLIYEAQAGWNESALSYSENYKFDVEDGFLATVWGSCHSPHPNYQRMQAQVVDWNVVNDDLYYRTLPTKLGLVKNSRGER